MLTMWTCDRTITKPWETACFCLHLYSDLITWNWRSHCRIGLARVLEYYSSNFFTTRVLVNFYFRLQISKLALTIVKMRRFICCSEKPL